MTAGGAALTRESRRLALRALPIRLRRSVLYRKFHGRALPTVPVRFSEKIQTRIVQDRRELISRGGDKLAMKQHASVACPEVAIPRTLWFGTDLESVLTKDWNADWVLKPLTASGLSVFGSGSMQASGVSPSKLYAGAARLSPRAAHTDS
jgi:hypothetical protein